MKVVLLVIVSLLYVGCGSGSTSEVVKKSVGKSLSDLGNSDEYVVARDITVHEIPAIKLNDYLVKVMVNKSLSEDDITHDTYTVFGTINNSKEHFVTYVNGKYPKDAKLVVRVFSKDGKLLAESQAKKIKGELDFGNITVK